MGGQLERCNQCSQERGVYDSCRNRHCPKCGLLTRAEWREKRQAETMPIDYYHVVNKAPGMEGIARDNPELVLDLLLWAAAEALKTIAANPKYLGAQIGFYQQLHTSSQMLEFHPHVQSGVGRWVIARRPTVGIVPGRLSAQTDSDCPFRRLVLNGVKKLFEAGKLQFFGEQAHLSDRVAFGRHLAKAKAKNWNVSVKRPIGGPEQVLDYMNRHAQSVAIANDRLLYIKDGRGFPMEGLPGRRQARYNEPAWRRVHSARPHACFAEGFQSHAPWRLSCKLPQEGKAGSVFPPARFTDHRADHRH